MIKKSHTLLFTLLMTFTVMSFVYFGFGNTYSSTIFNYADFQVQFQSGIYQYRILSGFFLEWIYTFLGRLNVDYDDFHLKFFNPRSEPQMFIALYVLNTLFSLLSTSMMFVITASKNFIATPLDKLLLIVSGIFVMGITQFVIVPYDTSSYFFLLLLLWIVLKYVERPSPKLLIASAVLLFLSALNRETAALSISVAATLLYQKYGIKKETILPVTVLAIIFIATYIGLRLSKDHFSTNDGSLLLENFTLTKNVLGLLFWAVLFSFSWLISKDSQARKSIIIFHLVSLPYILMCFYTGILYEVRLYVPLFLVSILLSRMDFSTIKNIK